jgi:SOS response regulatory protein OraA/RecX
MKAADDAHETALRALDRRDHSEGSLEARLERGGFGERERHGAIARLRAAGLVDDRRFAQERAVRLAHRDAGDRMIRADLALQGVQEEAIAAALEALESESERAARILARGGLTEKTLRRLSVRGFAEETLEPLIADLRDGAYDRSASPDFHLHEALSETSSVSDVDFATNPISDPGGRPEGNHQTELT